MADSLPQGGRRAENRSEIRLQVSDPSGAGLRASGSLAGPGTKRTFQTDVQGAFSLSGLAFERYQLQISSSGFVSRIVTVNVNSTAPVSEQITLTIQGISSSITVFSPTPIGQANQSLGEIPVRVRGLTAQDLEDSNALDLSDLIARRLTSVYINNNVGNPFQPDINYRGYTASPLLGTLEGLSVYLDGVRQNQPFGDIVAWDLIPKVAIWNMNLIPGSDPIYGLNTLGGAITVRTKDGLNAPGGSLQITGGKSVSAPARGSWAGYCPKASIIIWRAIFIAKTVGGSIPPPRSSRLSSSSVGRMQRQVYT